MSVGRICTRQVDLAELDEPVWQVAERMHQRSVGTLVVVDDRHHPIGVVTDRDLAIRVLARCSDPIETVVEDVMTHHPETVTEDTPIELALAVMRRRELRRLPVVDGAGRLVGLLALDDVLMLLSEELADIGKLLVGQTPEAAAVPL